MKKKKPVRKPLAPEPKYTPLDIIMMAINDPNVRMSEKKRLAVLALPYVHEKKALRVEHAGKEERKIEKPKMNSEGGRMITRLDGRMSRKQEIARDAETSHKDTDWCNDI